MVQIPPIEYVDNLFETFVEKMLNSMSRLEYDNAKNFAKSLSVMSSRLRKIKNKAFEDDLEGQMLKDAKTLLSFLSSAESYRNPHFIRSIIILDNIFSLDSTILVEGEITGSLIENVWCFLEQTLRKREENEEETIYGVLYFMLLLVSKCQESFKIRNLFLKMLFQNKFLLTLRKIDLKQMPKLVKIITVILTSMIKIKKSLIRNRNVMAIFNVLLQINNEEIKGSLLIVLKSLLSVLTFSDIIENEICQFLMCVFSSESLEQEKGRSLQIINNLLIRFPVLVETFLKNGFMNAWGKLIRSHERVCLAIFDLIISHVPALKLEQWFHKYYKYLDRNESSYLQVKILATLMKRVQFRVVLSAMETGLLQKVQSCCDSEIEKMKESGGKLKKALSNVVKQKNEYMWQTFFNEDHKFQCLS